MGNLSVLGKTRRRQDQPLTCGVGGGSFIMVIELNGVQFGLKSCA